MELSDAVIMEVNFCKVVFFITKSPLYPMIEWALMLLNLIY